MKYKRIFDLIGHDLLKEIKAGIQKVDSSKKPKEEDELFFLAVSSDNIDKAFSLAAKGKSLYLHGELFDFVLGMISFQAGDFKAAESFFLTPCVGSLPYKKLLGEELYWLAYIKAKEGRYDEVITLCGDAIAENELDPRPRRLRATAHLALGEEIPARLDQRMAKQLEKRFPKKTQVAS